MNIKPYIDKRVRKILTDMFGVSYARIAPESRMWLDLGLDSLDTVEFIMALEEELHIDLSGYELEDEMTQLKTYDEVLNFLVKHHKTTGLGFITKCPVCGSPNLKDESSLLTEGCSCPACGWADVDAGGAIA